MDRTIEQVNAILQYIPAKDLDYDNWLSIGMALKNEGYPFEIWDTWSIDDEHTSERPSKWNTFHSCGYRMGTIIKLAKERGCPPSVLFARSFPIDYKPTNGNETGIELEPQSERITLEDFEDMKGLNPYQQRIAYLAALFAPDEYVCIESSAKEKKDQPGKYDPCDNSRRFIAKTSELIKGFDSGMNLNIEYDPAGMWICINPTNGKGRKKENIQSWRWVLIESDDMPEQQQIDWLKGSGLPIVAISTSGGKSIHAVVRVDAPDLKTYRDRTEKIFRWCESNDFKIDKQTKNVNRLTRFPGFKRGNRFQELLYLSNPKTYTEWEKQAYRNPKSELKTAADYSVEKIDWLIPEAIPCQTITLIGAEGGTGKSTLVCDIIAGLIRGVPCAFDWGRIYANRSPKKVMLFSSEDNFPAITLPRLITLGCTKEDLKRLYVLPNTDSDFPNIKYNSTLLFRLIDKFNPDLIVFDPLQAFLPDSVDMSRRNHMRNILQELMAYLGDRRTAVMIVCHFNKSQTFYGVNRIADSKDITDLARSVFLMDMTTKPGPDGHNLRYLSHEKSSYARPLDTVLYTLESKDTEAGNLGFFLPVEQTKKKDYDFQKERQAAIPKKNSKKSDIAEGILSSLVTKEGTKKNELIKEANNLAGFQYGEIISKRTWDGALKSLETMEVIKKETSGFGPDRKAIIKRI
ncbi:AAA family ATPase [Ileibacterium valens]|uniref:AAA family ATPase n=1 Tax=Ileibacterium valens TaxID=1862668 RepID=UPI00272D4C17|nr:AAA family ATPase [Ileibacterium valens]